MGRLLLAGGLLSPGGCLVEAALGLLSVEGLVSPGAGGLEVSLPGAFPSELGLVSAGLTSPPGLLGLESGGLLIVSVPGLLSVPGFLSL